MGVLRAVVNVHVVDELTAEAVFRKHAFHHLDKEGVITGFAVLVEGFLHQAGGVGLTLAAGVAGVAQVDVILPLFAGELHFVGVDDNDVVATLNKRRIGGLVFAAEDFSDLRAKTAENLVGSIDHYPLTVARLLVG